MDNTHLYVIGDWSSSNIKNDLWIYDILSDIWVQDYSMSELYQVSDSACEYYNNNDYVSGGVGDHDLYKDWPQDYIQDNKNMILLMMSGHC